jgi:hypothetical protein
MSLLKFVREQLYVTFEVQTAVQPFGFLMLSSLEKACCFAGTYCLHIQGLIFLLTYLLTPQP